MPLIKMVITGGQRGADQAGWRAAKRFGITTSGVMPLGFRTESPDGKGWGERHPEFAELYSATEHTSADYPPRTRLNVEVSDLTLVFDTSVSRDLAGLSKGSVIAIKAAMDAGIPSVKVTVMIGEPLDKRRPAAIADRILELQAKVINIGGNWESKSPGIGVWVEDYLSELFRQLGFTELPTP